MPEPSRDDEDRDDSYAEWLRQREVARLQRVTEKRRQQRQPSAATLQRENDFSDWLRNHPEHADDERADTWPIFMRDRVAQREDARNAARRVRAVGGRGRLVDPNSQRQRLLAARAEHGSYYTLSMLRERDERDDPAAQQRRREQTEREQEECARRAQRRAMDAANRAGRMRLQLEAMQVDARLGSLAGEERHRAAEEQWRAVAGNHAEDVRRLRAGNGKLTHEADRAAAAACENSATANAVAAAAAAAAVAEGDAAGQAEAASALAETQAAATKALAAATAVVAVARVARRRRRRRVPEEFWALTATALGAAGTAGTESIRAALAAVPPAQTGPRSTEGQCQGTTRLGDRCRVHKSSRHGAAAPLREGKRYCVHHDPNKYTGVRCAGVRKKGRGQCNVWSGSSYGDAAPLRIGSKFCRHHQVRCAGLTQAGARCGVTSSSEHAHAEPLRQGELYCQHHRVAAADDVPAVCKGCGEPCGAGFSLCGECEDLHTWEDVERERTWRMEHPEGCSCGGVLVRGRGDMDVSEAWCDGCDWLNLG